jgi:hypothetical protein
MFDAMYKEMAEAMNRSGYARGYVMCRRCGSVQKQDAVGGLKHGWPKCCGHTMTIDVPLSVVEETNDE